MNNSPIINPKKFIEYLKQTGRLKNAKAPETVIFIFSESLLALCEQSYKLTKIEGFDAGDLYQLDRGPASIGIFYCRGIGSPVAVINAEELIAFGVKQFLVIGTAGSLQKHLNIGDMTLCNHAITDEGTSKHYVIDQTHSIPHSDWHEKFKSYLSYTDIDFKEGASWTTDAPYRETEEKVLTFQAKNVLCVEMEISALFTVANFRGVSMAAAFVISDSLADLSWSPGFFSEKVMESLLKLVEIAVQFSEKNSYEGSEHDLQCNSLEAR